MDDAGAGQHDAQQCGQEGGGAGHGGAVVGSRGMQGGRVRASGREWGAGRERSGFEQPVITAGTAGTSRYPPVDLPVLVTSDGWRPVKEEHARTVRVCQRTESVCASAQRACVPAMCTIAAGAALASPGQGARPPEQARLATPPRGNKLSASLIQRVTRNMHQQRALARSTLHSCS